MGTVVNAIDCCMFRKTCKHVHTDSFSLAESYQESYTGGSPCAQADMAAL